MPLVLQSSLQMPWSRFSWISLLSSSWVVCPRVSYIRAYHLQIGQTSSLVLTLCGVLKDVFLVAASTLLWATPVSSLQLFGHAISLAGLTCYKLGPSQLKTSFEATRRSWTSLSTKRTMTKMLILLCTAIIVIFLFLDILKVNYAPNAEPGTFLLSSAINVGLITWALEGS